MKDRQRHIAERAADGLLRASGGLRLARWLDGRDRPALRVLVYHRVIDPAHDPLDGDPSIVSATPDGFDAQMRAVARHYTPISVRDLQGHLDRGSPLPSRAVLVTFDDGYRDVMTHAWPILRQHGIPAVVFVPTAFPGQPRRFWWDEVWQMLGRAVGSTVVVPAVGSIDLRTGDARVRAARRLVAEMRPMRPEAVSARLEELRQVLGEPMGPGSVLAWDDLRRLAGQGLAVASHGRTHASLPALTAAELAEEIERADTDLASMLGATPRIFAYPFGHHDGLVAAALASRGYAGAMSTATGRTVLPVAARFAIHRQSVNHTHSTSRFHLGLAGFYPRPWARLRDMGKPSPTEGGDGGTDRSSIAR